MRFWQSLASGLKPHLIALGDRLVPKAPSVALRTFPDFDDQGRAVVASLAALHFDRVTWLVNSKAPPTPELAQAPGGLRIVPAGSLRGIFAYWRARVVVHTHGVYGTHRGSKRKTFVNIWHGMPIKRLDSGTRMGPNQTDITIATSAVHAANLASAWDLSPDQVRITGLPRNDVMLRAKACGRASSVREAVAAKDPLVVWLPTYRTSVFGQIRSDGRDFGNPFNLPNTSIRAVNEAMRSIGVHALLKLHPMAVPREHEKHSNLTIWTDSDLRGAAVTLYELLSHADVLISDQSSVWVDYLLLRRPIVFSIADIQEYEGTRGHYFSPLRPSLPGPLVTSLDDLTLEIGRMIEGDDNWRQARSEALDLHHVHRDDQSGIRVGRTIVELAGDQS